MRADKRIYYVMARKANFKGRKAAPFRKGGKPRKPGTVRKKPRKK